MCQWACPVCCFIRVVVFVINSIAGRIAFASRDTTSGIAVKRNARMYMHSDVNINMFTWKQVV